jgi:hypothetical protein
MGMLMFARFLSYKNFLPVYYRSATHRMHTKSLLLVLAFSTEIGKFSLRNAFWISLLSSSCRKENLFWKKIPERGKSRVWDGVGEA